jgi:hypothetical protein
MIKINNNENYQLFYLKKAINEMINDKNKDIIVKFKENHFDGCNCINNIRIPLTFPNYILNYTNSLIKEKSIDYNFIGTLSNKRNWVKKFSKNSVIKQSTYGRDINKKYKIDEDYFDILSKSKFTITPTGDCPWSYRFFEAILCLSIPILENNSNDIYMILMTYI